MSAGLKNYKYINLVNLEHETHYCTYTAHLIFSRNLLDDELLCREITVLFFPKKGTK